MRADDETDDDSKVASENMKSKRIKWKDDHPNRKEKDSDIADTLKHLTYYCNISKRFQRYSKIFKDIQQF